MWSTRSCVRRLYRAAAGVEFVRVKSQGPMSSPSRVHAGRGAPASSANVGSRSRCDVKRFDTPGTIRPGQRRRPNMRWPPSQAVNLPPRYGPCDRVPNASERSGCWPLSDVATTNVLSARSRRSSVCRTCAKRSAFAKYAGGPMLRIDEGDYFGVSRGEGRRPSFRRPQPSCRGSPQREFCDRSNRSVVVATAAPGARGRAVG